MTSVILINDAAPYRRNQTTHASLISTDEVKIELSRIEDFKMNSNEFQRGKVRVLWPMLYNCFRVGATFEMRTVLYGIRLLIDMVIMHDTESDGVGREQDSRETEKERGREAERCWK